MAPRAMVTALSAEQAACRGPAAGSVPFRASVSPHLGSGCRSRGHSRVPAAVQPPEGAIGAGGAARRGLKPSARGVQCVVGGGGGPTAPRCPGCPCWGCGVSVEVTWGQQRRAAVELSRDLGTGEKVGAQRWVWAAPERSAGVWAVLEGSSPAVGAEGEAAGPRTGPGAAVEGRRRLRPPVPQCPAALGSATGVERRSAGRRPAARAQGRSDAALFVYLTYLAIAEGAECQAVFALGSCWMPCRPGSRSPIKYPSVTRKTNARIPSDPH